MIELETGLVAAEADHPADFRTAYSMFASSFIRWSLHFQSNRSYYWSIARQPYFAGLEPEAIVLADSVAFALCSAGLHILDSSFACFAHVGSQV